uniref:Orf5 protein n=1 Tax=Fowl adenovirus A serotype 1 (strain CELO / Phelps) TaxID=10553 RepID=Q64789_ADEG1|nr:orf5 [Fowl aviadenovirus 1]
MPDDGLKWATALRTASNLPSSCLPPWTKTHDRTSVSGWVPPYSLRARLLLSSHPTRTAPSTPSPHCHPSPRTGTCPSPTWSRIPRSILNQRGRSSCSSRAENSLLQRRNRPCRRRNTN